MAIREDNESGRMGRLSLAVVCLASALVLLAWGVARAAPPVEGYWNCRAVVHPHVHLSQPSQNHAKRHRCKRVVVDPLTAAPEHQVGPRPETALEAAYRKRAQAAERRVQELNRDVDAANSRTEQVRKDTEANVRQSYAPLEAEVLDLRGWADQLERLGRYLLLFLADTPAAQGAGRIALSVLDSR